MRDSSSTKIVRCEGGTQILHPPMEDSLHLGDRNLDC